MRRDQDKKSRRGRTSQRYATDALTPCSGAVRGAVNGEHTEPDLHIIYALYESIQDGSPEDTVFCASEEHTHTVQGITPDLSIGGPHSLVGVNATETVDTFPAGHIGITEQTEELAMNSAESDDSVCEARDDFTSKFPDVCSLASSRGSDTVASTPEDAQADVSHGSDRFTKWQTRGVSTESELPSSVSISLCSSREIHFHIGNQVFPLDLAKCPTVREVRTMWQEEWCVEYASRVRFTVSQGAGCKPRCLGRDDIIPHDACVKLEAVGSILQSLAVCFKQKTAMTAADTEEFSKHTSLLKSLFTLDERGRRVLVSKQHSREARRDPQSSMKCTLTKRVFGRSTQFNLLPLVQDSL